MEIGKIVLRSGFIPTLLAIPGTTLLTVDVETCLRSQSKVLQYSIFKANKQNLEE